MRRIGNRRGRAFLLVLAGLTVAAIAIAGCGGGGDDGALSTPTRVQLQTPTAPQAPGSKGSAPRAQNGAGSSSSERSQSASGSVPGVERFRRALAPFRSCVQGHGVDPDQFQQRFQQRMRGQQAQPADPAEVQKEIQAAIACIPSLPSRLQAWAKRLARGYERRTG